MTNFHQFVQIKCYYRITVLVLSWLDYCNSATVACLDSLLTSSSISNLFRTLRLSYFQNLTVRTHYASAHQLSLAVRPRKYLLQTVSYDVSIHSRHLSILSTVMFLPRFQHDIQTTAAVFYLTSSGRSTRSLLYSRQAGVSGFWCHSLELSAVQRHICTVTRGFQTTTQDLSVFPFLPRHYHMSRVLLSPFITTVWTPMVLAIINII